MNMIEGGRKLNPIGQQSDRTLVQVIAAPRSGSSSNPAYITQSAADARYAGMSHTHTQSQIEGLVAALWARPIKEINDQLYAPMSHGHAIADVTGLQTALDGKASTSHNHDLIYAPIAHSHAIAQVTGLQGALDGKAALSHAHAIADVTGLQTALDGKANTSHNHDATYAALSHSHAIAHVTGLQGALDGKAASAHGHTTSDLSSPFQAGSLLLSPMAGQPVSALVPPYGEPGGLLRWSYTAWSIDSTSYALASHGHAIADVGGLQTALDGKASASHNHDLVYAPIAHSHSYLPLSGGTLAGQLNGTSASFGGAVAAGAGGVAVLSNWAGGNAATLSYRTHNTTTGYGFLQDQGGKTRVNSASSVSLCYLGYERLVVSSAGIHTRAQLVIGGSDGSTIYPGMTIASPIDWANANTNDSYYLVVSPEIVLPTPVARRVVFLDAQSVGPVTNHIRVPAGASWSVRYRDSDGVRQILSAGEAVDIYGQAGLLIGGNDGDWHLLTV